MEINKDAFIQQGILDCQIDQLINFSNSDPDIKKFTSDPIRFKNRQAFNQWLEHGRIIYTLIDQKNNLLGIVWFSQKESPLKLAANFTLAIRLYGLARGQGLSQVFLKTAFDDFINHKNKQKISGFWLQVSIDNLAAIRTYEKFGFNKLGQTDNKLIMDFYL